MKTLFCYGDSNTWGRTPERSVRYPFAKRWTGILEKSLGTDYRVVEEGLNGRCTVWEEPFRTGRNGAALLLPLLQSHAPIDLVILMLGTNDILHFSDHTAFDAARGAAVLIEIIQKSNTGINSLAPEILLVSPPKITTLSESIRAKTHGHPEHSADFAKHYAEIAQAMSCHFMNAADFCTPSPVDGVHLDETGHLALAKAFSEIVPRYC
jgi:lysophospholipase L1-like esterase